MCVCFCLLCSCVVKESVRVHAQYQRNPAAGFATKERRCPGREIKRGDGESIWKREEKKGRGKEEGDEKEVKWSTCIFIFCLFCHKLFKGYVLPTRHVGMGVKVEEFLMLFSRKPLKPILLTPLFFLRFPLSHHLALSLSLSPSLTQKKKILAAVVQPTYPCRKFY